MKALSLVSLKKVSEEKSTNVRKIKPRRSPTSPALPLALGLLSRPLPEAVARLAERLYTTPPRFPAPEPEQRLLEGGHRFVIRDHADPRGRELAAWSWGDGPTVVFLHGWGGRGGQFRAFVKPFVDAGYSVILFDAPGHGVTGRGESSLVDFAQALRAVVEAVGPIHAVVAHSMGAAATALAMESGLAIPRAVFVASPTSALDYFDAFTKYMRLSPESKNALLARLERRFKRPLASFRLEAIAPSMRAPLLVIHDREDRDVPLSRGEALHAKWPGAEMLTTEGLGHHRVLRAPEVVYRALAFVTGGSGGR